MPLRSLSHRRLYACAVLLSLAALLLAACGSVGQEGQPTSGGVAAAPPVANPQIVPTVTPTQDPCALPVNIVDVVSTGGGITGKGIMQLVVENPHDEDTRVRVVPGCTFAPPAGSGQQRMMVIQEASAVVPAGGTATLDPYVACIDADASAPQEGAEYTFGGMVPDPNLQQFAGCLARQDLPQDMLTDFDRILGLQFAVWHVSGGFSLAEFDEMTSGGGERAGNESVSAMLAEMMSLLGGMAESSQAWLAACGIEVESG